MNHRDPFDPDQWLQRTRRALEGADELMLDADAPTVDRISGDLLRYFIEHHCKAQPLSHSTLLASMAKFVADMSAAMLLQIQDTLGAAASPDWTISVSFDAVGIMVCMMLAESAELVKVKVETDGVLNTIDTILKRKDDANG